MGRACLRGKATARVAIAGGSSNKWCGDQGTRIVCQSPSHAKNLNKFIISDLGNGQVALKGRKLGKWCTDVGNAVRCSSPWMDNWEIFSMSDFGGGKIGLKGGKDG